MSYMSYVPLPCSCATCLQILPVLTWSSLSATSPTSDTAPSCLGRENPYSNVPHSNHVTSIYSLHCIWRRGLLGHTNLLSPQKNLAVFLLFSVKPRLSATVSPTCLWVWTFNTTTGPLDCLFQRHTCSLRVWCFVLTVSYFAPWGLPDVFYEQTITAPK